MNRVLAAVAALALALAGCTSAPPEPAATLAPTAEPVQARPQVRLEYRVADDLASLTGTEHITFTPDRRVCEIVLRSWVNKPATVRDGNTMEVSAVRVDGRELTPDVEQAGAPDGAPGTLVEVALPQCQDAGATLEIEADFSVVLGRDTDERVGYTRDLAWFATAFPMLDWKNGEGWLRDSAVDVVGEMATSETFILTDLAVTVPEGYGVSAVGERGEVAAGADGTQTHHFSAPAMRDVSVMVGDFEVAHREAHGVRVHLAVPDSSRFTEDEWWSSVEESLGRLVSYLGPSPYDDVWVAIVPPQSEGIEFSGAVQLGSFHPERDQWLVTHELAHQWFYGLVGNNQARHPWLDESMVSMVQAVADDPRLSPRPSTDSEESDGRMGWPMERFTQSRRPSNAYVSAVYTQGAAVLIGARDAAGHEDFDRALRNYLAANAHEIAEPADFEEAFAALPAVLDALEDAGAL